MIKFLGKRKPPGMHLHRCLPVIIPVYHLANRTDKLLPPASPQTQETAAALADPHPHPASPTHSLPNSFIMYRSKAQQHGPLGGHTRGGSGDGSKARPTYGAWGSHPGNELGAVKPSKGEAWDRSELPARFGRIKWTMEEMEAVELGGADLKVGWGGS